LKDKHSKISKRCPFLKILLRNLILKAEKSIRIQNFKYIEINKRSPFMTMLARNLKAKAKLKI